MEKRPALGKGLSALIPDAADALTDAARRRSKSTSISSSRITTSRADQSTTRKLEELARSIRANGVIQPIVVPQAREHRSADAIATRSSPANGAGAPRSSAQLTKVPIVVKDVARGGQASGCSRWR